MRYNASLGVASLALFVLPASGVMVAVVVKPDATLTNVFYPANRPPLLSSPGSKPPSPAKPNTVTSARAPTSAGRFTRRATAPTGCP